MNSLYLDCQSGIAGDMVLDVLIALGADKAAIQSAIQSVGVSTLPMDTNVTPPAAKAGSNHTDSASPIVKAGSVCTDIHRSYTGIKQKITDSTLSPEIKETALAVYYVIAKAEAQVHGATLDTVHFHEVGSDRALANIVGSAAALASLNIKQVFCSSIHDGRGFIKCSHGTIPVPVPAVMAMRKDCDFPFIEEPVETEMVTPTGLAMLMGMKAKHSSAIPPGQIKRSARVKGKRNTGKPGMLALLIQTP